MSLFYCFTIVPIALLVIVPNIDLSHRRHRYRRKKHTHARLVLVQMFLFLAITPILPTGNR